MTELFGRLALPSRLRGILATSILLLLFSARESSANCGVGIDNTKQQVEQRELQAGENCISLWAYDFDLSGQRCHTDINFSCEPSTSKGVSILEVIVDGNNVNYGLQLLEEGGSCFIDNTRRGFISYTIQNDQDLITVNWQQILRFAGPEYTRWTEVSWYAGPTEVYEKSPGVFTVDPTEFPHRHIYDPSNPILSEEQPFVRSAVRYRQDFPGEFYFSFHAIICGD